MCMYRVRVVEGRIGVRVAEAAASGGGGEGHRTGLDTRERQRREGKGRQGEGREGKGLARTLSMKPALSGSYSLKASSTGSKLAISFRSSSSCKSSSDSSFLLFIMKRYSFAVLLVTHRRGAERRGEDWERGG